MYGFIEIEYVLDDFLIPVKQMKFLFVPVSRIEKIRNSSPVNGLK